MIQLVIRGGCSTREPFNYQEEVFEEKRFDVTDYIFHKPTAVMASSKVRLDQNIIDQMKLRLLNEDTVQDFVTKQVDTSFNKEFFNKENKNEETYFLMDLVSERKKLIELDDSYIEYRAEFANVLKEKSIDYKVIKNSKELFYQHIEKFMAEVMENYSEERIILHKVFAVHTTKIEGDLYPLLSTFKEADTKSRLNAYSLEKANQLNQMFADIYTYIEDKYPNIKILELPIEKYYSPMNHKYGRAFFHYNKEYYYDFLKQLEKIMNQDASEKETKVAIENLIYINRMLEKDKVLKKMLKMDLNVNKKTLEEVLYNESTNIYNRLKYNIQLSDKTILKSYKLKDESFGILINNANQSLIGKLIFDKKGQLTRIYTCFKDKNPSSISAIDGNIIKTKFYDRNHEVSLGKIVDKKQKNGYLYICKNTQCTLSYKYTYNEDKKILELLSMKNKYPK